MKIMKMIIGICLMLVSVVLFAKDKESSTPQLSTDTKIEVKDAQLSLANAVITAQPHDIKVQIKQVELENAFRKAEESCGDLTKWQLNRVRLECELKPPPPPPPTPPTPEEQCKDAERKDLCIAEKKAQQKK